MIAESLQRVGAARSIVIDEDHVILAGNGVAEAAAQAGIENVRIIDADGDELIAVRRSGLTPEQKTALSIFDNRAAELAEWDVDVLTALQDDGVDLSAFWFDDELDALLSSMDAPPTPLTDPDDVPELPAEPVTKPGDLYVIGSHRVLCGDSTVITDVERLMAGEKADMVFTDPPYGVDVQERDLQQAEVRGRRKDGKGVLNDDLTGETLRDFLQVAFANYVGTSRAGACWYVCGPSGVDYRHPLNALAELGIARHGIVWVKDRFVMGRADYHYRHENIIYGWVPGAAHHEVPSRTQDTVWEFDRPGASPEHPTMKPVGLIVRALENSVDSAGLVVDPFGGSGSTLIACEQTGRRCAMMELDPRYVDVIVQRAANVFGLTAELVRD